MFIYSFAINAVVNILIILAILQSLFYLFSSKTNNQIKSANNWLHDFFNDSLNFLSFNTDSKPWPFNDKSEASDSNEDVEVVDGESEDLELGNDQPEQTT
jgi:predicted PurR-regulated permease PerM